MCVGLGTGTDGRVLPAGAGAPRASPPLRGDVAPNRDGSARAGLAVEPFDELERLDLAVDGADQVAPDGWLVKGGGAAHTREKVVAAAAERFVVIASSDKLVEAIGPPIPLEILSYGVRSTLARVAPAELRDVPPSPDGGLIADYRGPVGDPAALAARLRARRASSTRPLRRSCLEETRRPRRSGRAPEALKYCAHGLHHPRLRAGGMDGQAGAFHPAETRRPISPALGRTDAADAARELELPILEGGEELARWSWDEFLGAPERDDHQGHHCVTKWSKLDTTGGVSVERSTESRRMLRTSRPGATAATRRTCHVEDVTGGRAWVAFSYEGEPLDPEHGGGRRGLLVPHLYFWKSAKWVRGLRLMDEDEPGFWETLGYHLR